jgi:predicted DsbA family dithiol-disulfide isomerase
MSNEAVEIEVYSDVVCPWCYVGKRRLEQAMAQLDGIQAHVTWRPFQLNPTMPKEGMDRTTYLEAKFGSPDAFRRLEEDVLAAGTSEQIPFAFEKIVRTPNTFSAHRLIWYAGRHGRQDVVVASLFKSYFEEGADIGSVPTLACLSVSAGMDAERFLQSDEGVAEVKAEEAAGHRLGIRGVPYFLLDNTYGISGAQPVEVLVAAIEKVLAQQTEGFASQR